MALVNDLLNLLHDCKIINNVRVLNHDETPSGKIELKIRCSLIQAYQLQIWLHHEFDFQDYSYQLFTDHPILRWDNAPHYPFISSAPHHFHNEQNQVDESPLTGEVLKDLLYILDEIEKFLSYV